MVELYKRLEDRLENQGMLSELKQEILSKLPTRLSEIHNYKLFGSDLLAIPAEIIISGNEEEYENPCSFLDLEDGFENFENEFRKEIPKNYIPFGYLYGASEIVLYNELTDSVNVFNVSDISDRNWIKYKLENPICTFEKFISELRIQTVTCFINPKKYSEAVLLEIRSDKIYYDYELQPISMNISNEYNKYCQSLIEAGLEIHYAPKSVQAELKKNAAQQ